MAKSPGTGRVTPPEPLQRAVSEAAEPTEHLATSGNAESSETFATRGEPEPPEILATHKETEQAVAPDVVGTAATSTREGDLDRSDGSAAADPTFAATSATSRGRRIVLATLGVLTLAAGACTGYLALRSPAPDIHPSVSDQGVYTPGSLPAATARDAVGAASRALPIVLGYDYRSLDDHSAQSTRLMTDQFATTFRKTYDASVKPIATQEKAVTRALVRAVGLINEDAADVDQATCLAYVDQLLVSSAATDPQKPAQVSQNRVIVRLKRQNDQWLIDGLDPF